MTKTIATDLLYRCIRLENSVTTPTARKYWARRYDHFRALCVRIGWID